MNRQIQPALQIPVRSLVEYSLRSGDLVAEYDFSSGPDRAQEGIRAHQKIQDSRPLEYDAEVTLCLEMNLTIGEREVPVKIAGRMDGIFRFPDRIIIDEIKSTTKNPDWFAENENPVHWGQVKVYAYIYAFQNHLDAIDGQLTYIDTETGKIREYRKSFNFEELDNFFQGLLTGYLNWINILEKWYELRDKSIETLNFPFENYRPGQRHMALEIYRAIEREEQLMVEAPTGIGKTMGAIFPAVKALGNGLMEKFFYLTAKTTGRQVVQSAFEDLKSKGLKFKTLTLTAKEKICFNPGSACNGEECEFARGYFDRVNTAVETFFQQHDSFTRDIVEEGARQFQVCPFEFSLDLSYWMDAIICDYNYAFDPRVHLKRFFSEEAEKNRYVFLVDEANNMVDRSREMFSAEILKEKVLELRREIKTGLPALFRKLGSVNTRLLAMKKECEQAGQPLAKEEFPEEFLPVLRKFTRAAEQWLKKNISTSFRSKLIDFYFEISWFIKVAENFDEAYAFCQEKIDDDLRIKLFCVDPSGQLSDALDRSCSAIFFSATLSPLDYFRNVLGCQHTAKQIVFPSPFPAENLCLLVADRISTLYKYREQSKMKVVRMIDTLVKQQPGNYLVFFPSYQYLNMIYELFVLVNPHVERLVQTSGMTEAEREDFLENFSIDNRTSGKTLVGFAVMGGIFGEGIDLVGDRLTGAVIVGVGLPGISLERELIKNYFDRQMDAGFQYAYLFPGLNRVFQAAGRVIRSGSDRGAVLLVGQRFLMPQYHSLFPGHWQPVPVHDEENLSDILKRFW